MREVTRDADGSTALLVAEPGDLRAAADGGPFERIEVLGVVDVVADVDAALGTLRRALADGGALEVRVANVASRANRIAMLDGAFPPEGRPPLRHFTAGGLRTLLDAAGFEVLDVRTEPNGEGVATDAARGGVGAAFADRLDRTDDGDLVVASARRRPGREPAAAATATAPATGSDGAPGGLQAAQDELLVRLADEIAARADELHRMRSTRSWRWTRGLRSALARARG